MERDDLEELKKSILQKAFAGEMESLASPVINEKAYNLDDEPLIIAAAPETAQSLRDDKIIRKMINE